MDTLTDHELFNARVARTDAFGMFIKLMTDPVRDEEVERTINDSIVADMLGDEPKPNAKSEIDQVAVDLLHRFIALCYMENRFGSMEIMFGRHPWGNAISKSQHLENCYHLLCNECYILEERIKRFLSSIDVAAVRYGCEPVSKSVSRKLMSAHKQHLGDLVSMRGRHVHQHAHVPREIGRVELIETLSLGGNYLPDLLPRLRRSAVSDARRIWKARAKAACRSTTILAAEAITATKQVWEVVINTELAGGRFTQDTSSRDA